MPRQRRKSEQSELYSQVLAAVAPKRVTPAAFDDEPAPADTTSERFAVPGPAEAESHPEPAYAASEFVDETAEDEADDVDGNREEPVEEGFGHRRLIRAQLPRHEGQVTTGRQAPDFTIRQPATGRPKRFGGRPHRGGAQFQGNRHGGGGQGQANGNVRGGGQHQGGGRPHGASPSRKRHGGGGRNRSK